MNEEIEVLFPKMLFKESLKGYSTFNIGGAADYFYKAQSADELQRLVNFCRERSLPFFMLGGGSNVLFDDAGFRGMVIKMEMGEFEFEEGEVLRADAGVVVASLLYETMKMAYSGLERWVGLPGTIGGAIRGNAGCNGLETKDFLISAKLLDTTSGEIIEVGNDYFNFSYRESCVKHKKNMIVLEGRFQLSKREVSAEEQKRMVMEIRRQRVKAQPFGATTGSFFKNPAEGPAGLLIEKAGIKGSTIGGAQISEKHGNFFLNLGEASSADILALKELAQGKVLEEFGVELEPEVYYLPERIAV